MFVANTPMEFGERRLALLRHAGWEVMNAEGQFFGLQNLYAWRGGMQRRLFGHMVRQGHRRWRIFVVRKARKKGGKTRHVS